MHSGNQFENKASQRNKAGKYEAFARRNIEMYACKSPSIADEICVTGLVELKAVQNSRYTTRRETYWNKLRDAWFQSLITGVDEGVTGEFNNKVQITAVIREPLEEIENDVAFRQFLSLSM